MLSLHRSSLLVCALPLCGAMLCAGSLLAQATNAAPASPAQASDPATTLRTGTQLVIVDVNVLDRSGNPVHGLKASDFVLSEDKTAQDVRHFEEHRFDDKIAGPVLPAMPPGMFTNYTPVPPDSTLNVLLIDTLNTPMKDQSFVRNQLAEYVKKARPGTHVAIFGMSSRLYLLQGFTSDPEILKDAVEHKLLPRASAMLDDPVGTNADQTNVSDVAADAGAPTAVVSSLQQFEAQQESFQTQMRMRYTLDAFNALAHYLSGFPGRKNLVWFSGAFPISISPDPSINNPFAVMADVEQEFRETTNLLARAQVAVYPVDARGLMVAPMFSAANSGTQYVRNPGRFAADSMKFTQSQADEHGTMDEMATDTGGKAFYNTNGLADATAKAIDAGANYYTLVYSPANHNWNGAYRAIHVALSDQAKASGYVMTYRHGYYADNPYSPKKSGKTASLSEAAAAAPNTPGNFARLAMQRGAPTPHDILIKALVLPASDKTEDKPAAGNELNPNKPVKPPFRNYTVDLVALTQQLSFEKTPDGKLTDTVEVKIYVYDTDGALLNIAGSGARLSLAPESYQQLLKSGMQYHALVSAPARGESFLRIGIHDMNSDHFGVVEVPISRVARLPPANALKPAATDKPPADKPAPPKP